MDINSGLRQRQGMARGDGPVSGGDFGCEGMTCGPSMGPAHGKMHDRSDMNPVKHSRGKMPAQAMPDHGPHGYGKTA